MPYAQQIIIEGKFLGTITRKPAVCHESLQPPASLAYFCPHCAELWARCPVTLPDGGMNKFQSLTIPCRKHQPEPYSQRVPGSLFLAWDRPFNDACLQSEGVLKWELARLLELSPEED